MFVQDQAAWHATDALVAQHPQTQLMAEKVRGWIVEDGTDGTLVRFIRAGEDGPEAAYDIRYAAGADYAHDKPTVSIPADRHLSDAEKIQYSARLLAIKSLTERCGDNYNTVVLKDPEGDGWLAWALAATNNPSKIMAGGHHRLTVSADGTKVIQMDALSRSCLVLDKASPDGKKVDALLVTQLVSDLPVETYVFLSLENGFPFLVLTPDKKVWEVANGHMKTIDLNAKSAPQ
jgi:hypothetical protein